MRPISKWPFSTGAVVLIATLGLFAVQPARATEMDPSDPSITPGYSLGTSPLIGTNGGTETTSNTWIYTNVVQTSGDTTVSFLNKTGSDWTSLEIIANYTDATDHTYTVYLTPNKTGLPSGASSAFSSSVTPVVTSDTVTFNLSGAHAVDNGDYLVFTYTNWNAGQDSDLKSFEFVADPVPEPGTMMLLGAGFFVLAIFGKRRINA